MKEQIPQKKTPKISQLIPKAVFFLITLCLAQQVTQAQNLTERTQPSVSIVKRNTDTEKLEQLSKELQEKYQKNYQIALQKAAKAGWYTTINLADGRMATLAGLDDLGNPLYVIEDNLEAARTTSTHKLWEGGGLGLSLDGEGLVSIVNNTTYSMLGMWEVGRARLTHQEYIGRVVQQDSGGSDSNHASHVGGTLVGEGIVGEAKGMAFKARLDAYTSNNDASEMAFAASRGMLVSNHSYGTVTGWAFGNYAEQGDEWHWFGDPSLSETEDFKFGYYDTRSRDWDRVAYNAPYYLIVKSAGNDRNDNISGGTAHQVRIAGEWTESNTVREKDGGTSGYDCISTYSNAKNILTVGAVEGIANGYDPNGNPSQVVMSSFSGWGPTDDGRIKPDIVAQGVSLYSASSNGDDAYSTLSGTSMSAPNISGSLLLLQQHYQNLKGEGIFMRSATLKALAIHTAEEAGTHEGPDYKFGWGLFNAAKAANFISTEFENTLILEQTLQNDEEKTFELAPTNDGEITVTLCWTDPEGTPVASPLNSTTPLLVNDLDIQIESNTGDVFFPYILDPADPNAAATTGDNFRDNVEKIYIANANATSYTLTVRHKGTLSAPQDFSLLIEGATSGVSDVGVLDISSVLSDCELNTATPVTVTLRNYGTIAESNIPLSYTIENVTTDELLVQDNIIFEENIAPGQNKELSLPLDLGTSNTTYRVSFTTTLNQDEDASNDDYSKEFTNLSPDAQASDLVLTNPLAEVMQIDWNNNGQQSLVLVKANTPFTAQDLPVQNQIVTTSSTFGGGTQVGEAYGVYRGGANSIRVFGLDPGITYYVAVLSYNCTPPTYILEDYPAANTLITSLTISSNTAFKMFPNPATQQVFVEMGQWANQEVEVRLLNSLGVSFQPQFIKEGKQLQIDLGKLPAGVYTLQLSTDKEQMKQRLIIY